MLQLSTKTLSPFCINFWATASLVQFCVWAICMSHAAGAASLRTSVCRDRRMADRLSDLPPFHDALQSLLLRLAWGALCRG